MKRLILYYSIFLVTLSSYTIYLSSPKQFKYDCTSEEKQEIETLLKLNNGEVLQELSICNTKFIVRETINNSDDTLGLIEMRNGNITISMKEDCIEAAINHEIGHFVSYEYKEGVILHETEEFIKIYEEEKNFFDSYCSKDSSESFAQGYKYYIECNEDFQLSCPKMNEYFKELIHNE